MLIANNLEHGGKLDANPVIELLHEAAEASLSGTFRLSNNSQKIAVYLDQGRVIYAATNLRQQRLAVKLVEWNFLNATDVAELENLPDFEVAAKLVAAKKIAPESLAACQNRLVGETTAFALGWTNGEWSFNTLVRVREDLRCEIELPALTIKAARALTAEFVASRFGFNALDSVAPAQNVAPTFSLTSEEAFVLSRLETATSCEDLASITGLPDSVAKKSVYALWTGGLLQRMNYPRVFDEATIQQMLAAQIKLRQPESVAQTLVDSAPLVNSTVAVAPTTAPNAAEIVSNNLPNDSLINSNQATNDGVEEYLDRIESAKNYYQLLNVANAAAASDVKQSYFKIAKNFHPDKFHKQAGSELHARLQNAFRHVAHAYETLKDPKARHLYDFKISKEGAVEIAAPQTPADFFKQGVQAFDKADYTQAVALLNRAVQLAPNIAEYHAHLGRVLARNPSFRHQAESELQTAVRLDDKNSQWRIMVAEFYAANGLGKRAAAELNRVLAHEPKNEAARALLAQLS